MANADPHQARLARRRRRKPGDLAAVTRVLWNAICEAETVLETPETNQQLLQACHALAQACTAYTKLLEVGEIEARLAALEAAAQAMPS